MDIYEGDLDRPQLFIETVLRMDINTDTLNWIMGGLAIVIGIGAFLMMFTTIWTSPNRK